MVAETPKRGPGRPRKDPAGTQKDLAKARTLANKVKETSPMPKEPVKTSALKVPKVVKKPERKGPTPIDLRRQMEETIAKKMS